MTVTGDLVDQTNKNARVNKDAEAPAVVDVRVEVVLDVVVDEVTKQPPDRSKG